MKTVIVCGAGVDKSEGINMPLASELVPRIRDFLKTEEGKKIDNDLRRILPNLRFSYDKFIKQAVDKLSNDFRGQVADIVDRINSQIQDDSLSEENRKLGSLILILLIKIQKLQEDVRIDPETEKLINDVFGGEIVVEDEDIIELPKLSFTDVFNNVMRRILERSLEEPENPILRHVRGNLMDFERLLMDSFIGFYTHNENQMKTYMYLSWTLWAFLKHCETSVSLKNSTIPFYSSIPDDWDMVTLNYTSFAKQTRQDKALYFHGELSSFVRMRDRQLVPIDGYFDLNINEFMAETIVANTCFDKGKKPSCIVPSIIPPLKMKPVLSNTFIEIWYKTKEVFNHTDRIVVAGYSFNYADEHFNDLIRCNKDKKIFVIDPCAEIVRDNLKNIFSHAPDDYVSSKIQAKDTFTKDNLTIVKARATDIDWSKI